MSPVDVSGLAKLEAAERMLSECRTVQQAVVITDLAEAARVFARQAKLGTHAENHATAIKLKAEIMLVALVDEGRRRGLIATDGRPTETVRSANGLPMTLAELGVDRPRLTEARQIAAVYTPDDIDEIALEANAEDRSVSRRSIITAAARARARASVDTEEAVPAPDPTATDRQRRHRLWERRAPAEPLADYQDPGEFGDAAITAYERALNRVSASPMGSDPRYRPDFEVLEGIPEVIKKLMWRLRP